VDGIRLRVHLGGSLCLAGTIADHGNEQVSDAGCTHLAERGETLTVGPIKQQNAAPEALAFFMA